MAVAEGRLQIRDWKDREGNNRRSAEVVADNVYFGDSKRDSNPDRESGYGQSSYGGSYGGGYSGGSDSYGAAPSGGYDAPSRDGGHEFMEIDDQDGNLPF